VAGEAAKTTTRAVDAEGAAGETIKIPMLSSVSSPLPEHYREARRLAVSLDKLGRADRADGAVARIRTLEIRGIRTEMVFAVATIR